jgi:HEAT repeat protein
LPLSVATAADERPTITPERLKLLSDDVKSGTQGLRIKAARELARVGPAAKPAVPALRGALKAKDGEVRMEAALALLQIDQTQGKEALTAIRDLFKDDSTAPLAILVLPRMRELRPVKKEVAAGLFELARDKHPLASIAAWMALDNIGPGSEDCVAVLREALKDPHPGIRGRAAAGLVQIDRKNGVEAEPVLLKVLDDPKAEADIQFRAAIALLTIDTNHKERERVGKVLARALSDPNTASRLDTAELLIRLGLPAQDVEPTLREMFKDPDAKIASRAVEAVIRLRPEKARELFSVLLQNRARTAKDDILTVFKLVETLYGVFEEGKNERELLKTLTEQLRRPLKSSAADLLRLDAAIRLAALGTKAQDATADLALALDDPSAVLRSQALYALKQIGPLADKAVPRLVEFLKDAQQPRDLHRAAAEALKQIAPERAKELGIR